MSSYDRALVERLLPAVWDKDYAYGMENPTAPQPVKGCQVHAKRDGTPKEDCACCDPATRKATSNPKLGNTLYAHLGDIHAAWRCAGLSLDERRVLLLRYGMDWREREISAQLGVPQQTVSDRLVRGVGRLVSHLNGTDPEDIDDTATLTSGSDTNP